MPTLITDKQILSSDATCWEDLRFPAQAIDPAGSTAPASRNNATGLLDFSGTTDNAIAGVGQMPHAWKEGSAIYPHIHLRFPTSASANTRWKLEYDVANVSGDFANDPGVWTDGGTITVANPQNIRRHAIASFPSISMTGKTISACILWRLSRLAGSDDADNHTAAVALVEFDIHYEIDAFGSDSELVK